MKLFIDGFGLKDATLITRSDEYGPRRRYYDVSGVLVVCHNGLELLSLLGRVVDAQTGKDVARQGFTIYDEQIGKTRLKITIRRVLRELGGKRLSEVIEQARRDGLSLIHSPGAD